MAEMSIIDLACKILAATHDGDDLAPEHLGLVELAVNNNLNETGIAAFHELVKNVEAGYQRPWFHDIEHLTIDHIGYVYWKGSHVEHYDQPWAYSEQAKSEALELAQRCQHLESIDVPVNATNAVWNWELYEPK